MQATAKKEWQQNCQWGAGVGAINCVLEIDGDEAQM
jgi:hypothetical protein